MQEETSNDPTSPAQVTFTALVLAAGRGERMGSTDGPKQYRDVGGKTILRLTLEAFLAHPLCRNVVVAIHREDEVRFQASIAGLEGDVRHVEGGASRQASTRAALEAMAADAPGMVLIHDAARPFVDHAMIDRVLVAIRAGDGVVPALPVSDTLKKAGATGLVEGTVARGGLFSAQTPQGFVFDDIVSAHRQAATAGDIAFTDDASIAEWAGIRVHIVEGAPQNMKITWPHDIEQARQRLAAGGAFFPDIRTGNGYDVHAFEDGDRVVLCGIEIAHDRKLSGHSDADVGLHALTDALLATCGAGDIGTHFPPSDPQWKGARSRLFVEHAVGLVRERYGRIANADVTLICEAPRIGEHRQRMCAEMADMLRIEPGRVSVKATTNERLGFVGRGEGIAAIATVSVAYPGEIPE